MDVIGVIVGIFSLCGTFFAIGYQIGDTEIAAPVSQTRAAISIANLMRADRLSAAPL